MSTVCQDLSRAQESVEKRKQPLSPGAQRPTGDTNLSTKNHKARGSTNNRDVYRGSRENQERHLGLEDRVRSSKEGKERQAF